MKKTFILSFYMLLFLSLLLEAQTNNVVFLNTGRMNVSTNGKLYIAGAMRHLSVSGGDSVKVVQNGITDITGGFYQDALTNVFDLSKTSSITASTGTVRFVANNGSNARRYITTFTPDSLTCSSFDRSSYYVAFPNVVIDTNDSLVIPARMGIDALSIHTGSTNTGGKMILRSDRLGNYDYDASLRITGAGTSSTLVDAGSVIVEREVGLYRGTESLFPFASPFNNTQLSGYFAGNWVRRPLADADYGSTTYLYGNRDINPKDNIIDIDQYVRYATEPLVAGQAYLVKPRPAGFDYSTMRASGGLGVTDADPILYDKGKFTFNGAVYSITPYSEQLFADDNLVSKTVVGTPSATVNWLIGNSYSCPISTVELAKLLRASSLTFSPVMYIYSAGSQSYQPMSISTSGSDVVVSNYAEIPSMGIFLIRLSKNTMQNGTFTIGKSVLRHGKYSHGTPNAVRSLTGSSAGVTDQINFRMTPADNENAYDLAAIGLRDGATRGSDKYDVAKAYNSDNRCFQLYTLSSDNTKLSANGVPVDIDYVTMAVKPAAASGNYKITATNVETLSSEGAWLEDMQTDSIIDLKSQPTYTFTTNSTDSVNRFRVYFVKQSNNEVISKPRIFGTFTDNNFVLDHLNESDMGALVRMYDMYGRELKTYRITSYPQMSVPGRYPPGVYAVSILSGSRSEAIRVVKPENK